MISRGAGLDPPWPLASPWEGQGSPWDLAPLRGQGLLEGLLLVSSPGELGLPLGRGGRGEQGVPGAFIPELLAASPGGV